MRSPVGRSALGALQISVVAAMLVSCAGQGEESTVLVKDYGMFSENGVTEEKSRLAMNEVMAGPTFEEALASYGEMLEEMRSALSLAFPNAAWEKLADYPSTSCGGDYVSTNAVYTLVDWKVTGMTLGEGRWNLAVSTMKPIAARYGLGNYIEIDGRAKSRFSEFRGPQFASASITAQDGFWGIGLDTGCHLPQAVKDKVLPEGHSYWTPAPSPTDSPTGP